MGITLFTSRVVLQVLGATDYGIYNVVGGLVVSVGIIKGILGTGAARFITIGIGKGDIDYAKKSFSACIDILVVMCVIFLILAETVGLWFLNTKLVIPADRLRVANWVFQLSVFTFIVNMLSGPYDALIKAYEKMSAFAYISIIDVVLKLLIAYALIVSPIDKLILYAVLMFLVNALLRYIYSLYCKFKIKEIRYKYYGDKKFYKTILSFTGWTFLGQMGGVVKDQGLNILLNMFFNPAVNASRAIAYQVNHAVKMFADNFYTAVRPQVTKYYAQKDWKNLYNLVFRSSKISFYLLLIIALPVVIEAPFIIKLWLGQEPEDVVLFVRFIVVITAFECMQNPLRTTAMATGRIALYEISITIVMFLNIPISYILLKHGAPAVSVFIVSMLLEIANFFIRVLLLKRLMDFPVLKYYFEIFVRSMLTTAVAVVIPIFVYVKLPVTYLSVLLIFLLSVGSTVMCILFLGLNKDERNTTIALVTKYFKQ